MTFRKLIFFSSILALAGPTALAETAKRQHSAHEHGVSKLQIALEQNSVLIELEAPGADIVGFEHKAEDDEQRRQVSDALALLKQPSKIFDIPSSAGCSIASASAELESEEDGEHEGEDKTDHEEGADHKEDAGHNAFHASYKLDCSSSKNLAKIGIRFFKLFSNASEIELEAISDKGQLAKEIGSDETIIDLSSIID